MDTARLFEHLQRECLIARYAYYVKSRPLRTDYDYDRLEQELKKLKEQYPQEWAQSTYRSVCPTETVGSDLESSYPPEIATQAEERVWEAEGI